MWGCVRCAPPEPDNGGPHKPTPHPRRSHTVVTSAVVRWPLSLSSIWVPFSHLSALFLSFSSSSSSELSSFLRWFLFLLLFFLRFFLFSLAWLACLLGLLRPRGSAVPQLHVRGAGHEHRFRAGRRAPHHIKGPSTAPRNSRHPRLLAQRCVSAGPQPLLQGGLSSAHDLGALRDILPTCLRLGLHLDLAPSFQRGTPFLPALLRHGRFLVEEVAGFGNLLIVRGAVHEGAGGQASR